jgi:hypothetical protein
MASERKFRKPCTDEYKLIRSQLDYEMRKWWFASQSQRNRPSDVLDALVNMRGTYGPGQGLIVSEMKQEDKWPIKDALPWERWDSSATLTAMTNVDTVAWRGVAVDFSEGFMLEHGFFRDDVTIHPRLSGIQRWGIAYGPIPDEAAEPETPDDMPPLEDPEEVKEQHEATSE